MFKIYFQKATMFFWGGGIKATLAVSICSSLCFTASQHEADNAQLGNINVSVMLTETFVAPEVHKRGGEPWDPSPSACSGPSSRVRSLWVTW